MSVQHPTPQEIGAEPLEGSGFENEEPEFEIDFDPLPHPQEEATK